MSAGSQMWSSTLTRIMSSARMAVAPGTSWLRGKVEVEETDRVAANDLVHGLVGKVPEQLLGHRARVGPRAVLVRVVGLEQRVVDADPVEQLDARAVLEEAGVHLTVVIGGRRLGNVGLAVRPA